ncbi:MAG: CDP-alcohol phosphatidyltransferase family protein [Clostridia bacterium]|nr:CDP-alcohol phosphatidyltransferase family protein [Clostridia bacterium]
MANIITSLRIILSAALLFCPALSAAFYAVYAAAGITDMIDGAVARKMKTTSEFGSRLDTIADLSLVAASLIKLLPVLDIPIWLCIWIGAIAAIKSINIAYGFALQKKLVAMHSVMNKIAGAMLFLFPFTLPFIDFRYGAAVVCAAATAAAVHEWHCVRTGRKETAGFLPRHNNQK